MLLGEFKRADLEQKPYATWFNTGYKSYKPQKKTLKTIKNNIGHYKITMFMGTWCPDSKREVPQFFKLLDLAGYDSGYALTYSKKTPKSL